MYYEWNVDEYKVEKKQKGEEIKERETEHAFECSIKSDYSHLYMM